MKERIQTGTDGVPVYTAIDGDTVDSIAYQYYGRHAKNTEAIYLANPRLCEIGPILPAGTKVRLPNIVQVQEVKPFRQLWN